MGGINKKVRSLEFNYIIMFLLALILYYMTRFSRNISYQDFIYFEFGLELLISFICLNIFLLMIYTYNHTNNLKNLSFSSSFLFAGLINFAHAVLVLDFIDYNNYDSINAILPLVVELIIALSFLSIGIIKELDQYEENQYSVFFISGFLPLIIIYILGVWFYFSSIILVVEILLIIILLFNVIIYIKRFLKGENRLQLSIFNGFIFLLLAQLLFSFHRMGYFSYTIIPTLAHLYKLLSFGYIFKGFFVEEIINGIIAQKEVELKKLEIRSQQELIKSLRVQRHDFKNELQTIYTMLQLNKGGEALDYIKDLHYDLNKVESSNNISSILESVLLPKQKIAVNNSIKFNIDVEVDMEKISFPQNKLLKILFNLVDNAFDAVVKLPKEKRRVEVKMLERVNNINLIVYNNGPIIPKDKLNHIFMPGYSSKGEERGFGLYIVKSLLEDFNGRIKVESKEERGTKFICYFSKEN